MRQANGNSFTWNSLLDRCRTFTVSPFAVSRFRAYSHEVPWRYSLKPGVFCLLVFYDYMAASTANSSQSSPSQASLCIGLGVLICLVALIYFFLGGGLARSEGVSGYGGYGYGAYAGAGGSLAPMLPWPQLLLLSFGLTLIVVGIVTLRNES